jgi:Mg2+-importing ATPase
VGVFVAALRFSDAKEFAELARRAEPGWLVVAIVLQAGTYLAAGQVFRGVVHAAGHAMGLGAATRLSLTKLCVDQAIPSAGLSGATFVANELEQRGIPRPVVAAGIVVDLASYHAAHMLSLAIALIIAAVLADVDAVVLLVALVFFALGTGFSLLVLAVTGGRRNLVPRRLRRLGPLRIAIDFVSDADPRLARDPRRLLRASTCQLAVVLFDATTVWVLVRSLGDHASPSGVFASYMISSLLQTVGIVPGGLGAFEAASVVTLRIVGVATPVALAATFLFRGLSFWLPMLPGLWFSRHVVRRAGQAGRAPGRRTDRRKD